jgi:thiol-disulfide isomerase/thioredoxin
MGPISSPRRSALIWYGKLSLAGVLAFGAIIAASAPALLPQTANDLFASAKAEAKTEHKNVLLVFSASWCGPCKLYERFLEDPAMKSITEKAFVVQRIDVGERPEDSRHSDTPGGAALRSSLGADREPGFPFLVMTDDEGNPIINSYRNGDKDGNIGYPALPAEIDWYLVMLKRAAPSLSSDDLVATRTWLRKHAPH